MSSAEQLEAALLPACASLGVELFDFEYRRGVVRITVDRAGGLDLDAVAEVARALSSALDETEAAPNEHYELEVSTPGLERRLRRPQHFRAAVGEQVALRTTPGTPGERRFEGTLRHADDDGMVVVEATGAEHSVAYDAVERAHTVFDWRAALAKSRESDDTDSEEGSTTTSRRATTS